MRGTVICVVLTTAVIYGNIGSEIRPQGLLMVLMTINVLSPTRTSLRIPVRISIALHDRQLPVLLTG